MTTVLPATTTAAPEVAVVLPIDSLELHAVVELLAMPGDEEQAVVDGDAEAEQRGDRRCRGGQVDRDRHQTDQGQAGADAEHRTHQRDQGGDDRAEHDEEEHQRRPQADRLGQRVVGSLADLPGAAAVLDREPGLARRLDRVVEGVEVVLVQ